MNGVRLQKPPTRRQLATKLTQAVPIVNGHTSAIQSLHERLEAVEATLTTWTAPTTFRERVRRLFQGAP